jgi:hypothetical protein
MQFDLNNDRNPAMNRQLFALAAAVSVACAVEAAAAGIRIAEQGSTQLAHPHDRAAVTQLLHRSVLAAKAITPFAEGTPQPLDLYPVGGMFGRDLYIPYFVDVDPASGVKRDFNCTEFTFDGHDGDDPYIRSFREQDIGVPIFAPRDARVGPIHDGEDDHNTVADNSKKPNSVTLYLTDGTDMIINHLRKGSILVTEGQRIAAGTQVGLVGSSGSSTAPHAHIGMFFNSNSVEPFAGPCRPGASLFVQQPAAIQGPVVIGTSFSNTSYAAFAPAPFDDAPRTGTFVKGPQRIYFKAELANLPPDAPFQISVVPPNTAAASDWVRGTFANVTETSRLGSFWWGIDADLNTSGEWTLLFDVGPTRLLSVPFRVVDSASEIVNRAPIDISAVIDPAVIHTGQAPVCRVEAPTLVDADYDIVSYRYEWKVDDVTVRTFTSAVRSDALAADLIHTGSRVSCSITPNDGKVSGNTATAFAGGIVPPRRRAAGQ